VLEDELITHLRQAVADADVVVAMDQVPEPRNGVLTHRVKAALAELAAAHPDKVFIADSRTSIGEFRGVRIKTGRTELARHFGVDLAGAGGRGQEPYAVKAPDPIHAQRGALGADVQSLALRWSRELGQDVFVTLGEEGILAASGGGVVRVPGIRVEPPIDVVGAGDTVLAHIAMALAAGATAREAAELGNLAGAVVVKKLGTTGTATVEEVAAVLARV
jgi:sugar/nucleoside kinase (ribokinase family)